VTMLMWSGEVAGWVVCCVLQAGRRGGGARWRWRGRGGDGGAPAQVTVNLTETVLPVSEPSFGVASSS